MRFWDASAIIPLIADEPDRERMLALVDSWQEIVPSDAVRRTAERLLRVHPPSHRR